MNDKSYAIGRDLNRVPLYTVVPRSVPFAIGIGPCDICNFRCNYCAQSIGTVKDARVLQWDEYLSIIDQIKELIDGTSDRIKIMKFIGNGEPLINPKTPDMVKIAVDNNLADRYELTTNGSLLTHEISDRLLEAGLTRLLISIKKYISLLGLKNEVWTLE